jgi:hypothetical protein
MTKNGSRCAFDDLCLRFLMEACLFRQGRNLTVIFR